MTRDEAIERVVGIVVRWVASVACGGGAPSLHEEDELCAALRDLLDASEQHFIARGETTGPWSADE